MHFPNIAKYAAHLFSHSFFFHSCDLRYLRIDKLVNYLKDGCIQEENTQWHYKYFFIFLYLILDLWIYFLDETNVSVKNTVGSLLIEQTHLRQYISVFKVRRAKTQYFHFDIIRNKKDNHRSKQDIHELHRTPKPPAIGVLQWVIKLKWEGGCFQEVRLA